MEIYLLRHGIAEDTKPGGRDADRALTAEGKRRLKQTLRVARDAGMCPSLILSSPYKRALESAQIAAEISEVKSDIIETPMFTPGADPREAWNEIRLHKTAESILIATHEPFTGLMIAHLLGAPSLLVDVKKGCITRIDVEAFGPQPRGVLRWMLTARLAGAKRD